MSDSCVQTLKNQGLFGKGLIWASAKLLSANTLKLDQSQIFQSGKPLKFA